MVLKKVVSNVGRLKLSSRSWREKRIDKHLRRVTQEVGTINDVGRSCLFSLHFAAFDMELIDPRLALFYHLKQTHRFVFTDKLIEQRPSIFLVLTITHIVTLLSDIQHFSYNTHLCVAL